jgi:uncharacterized RDD family membrane protein YckC
MVYDSLVLIALVLTVGAVLVVGLKHGEITSTSPYWRLLLQLSVALVPVVFFVGFWTHGGQTLGMKAWRLVLVTERGTPPGYSRAAARLAASLLSWLPLGLGYLWLLIDRDHLAWHDRLSGTRLVLVLPPRPPDRYPPTAHRSLFNAPAGSATEPGPGSPAPETPRRAAD